ncbi:MAG TPA: BON domain-containing protein [Longimicrobiales bacterium]|nr:BON domain-containing protein [Longimicrobiales bacterium]
MNLGKVLTVSLGAAGAVALGFYLSRRDRQAAEEGAPETRRTEERVRQRIHGDGLAHDGTLRISALTPGIVELSGTLREENDAHRAVGLAQEVEGVHTVVNRIEVSEEGSRLARNRDRYEAGEPELTESHWYGQRVGTGRRRQGLGTDPDRPDDKVERMTRELGAAAARDEESEPLVETAPARRDPTAVAAAPTSTGGVDEGRARSATDARGDASPRALNTAARVGDTPKPGVERALEEAGLRRQPAPEQHEESGDER